MAQINLLTNQKIVDPKNAILATALGFIIAVAGVVLFELLDDRIKRAEDIEDGMGLVLLGVVPDTKTGKR